MNASVNTLLFRTELSWRESKVITKVGGQDEKGQFKVGRSEGKRKGQTDGSNS